MPEIIHNKRNEKKIGHHYLSTRSANMEKFDNTCWGRGGKLASSYMLVGVKISTTLKEGNLPDLSKLKLHIFPLTLQTHSWMFSLKIYSHVGKNDA